MAWHGGFLHGNLVHERIDHALGVRLVLCRKHKARGAHVPPSEPLRAKIRRAWRGSLVIKPLRSGGSVITEPFKMKIAITVTARGGTLLAPPGDKFQRAGRSLNGGISAAKYSMPRASARRSARFLSGIRSS